MENISIEYPFMVVTTTLQHICSFASARTICSIHHTPRMYHTHTNKSVLLSPNINQREIFDFIFIMFMLYIQTIKHTMRFVCEKFFGLFKVKRLFVTINLVYNIIKLREYKQVH